MLKNAKIAITAEEGMLNGGFGSAVNDFCLKNEFAAKIINVGVDDHTVKHADFLRQLKDNGIDGKKFADLIDKYLSVYYFLFLSLHNLNSLCIIIQRVL